MEIKRTTRHPSVKSRIRRVRMKFLGRYGRVIVPDKWVFIAGCTNSGTTLLKRILSAHPSIASSAREGRYYTDQFPAYGQYGRLWALHADELRMDERTQNGIDVERLKRQWCGVLNRPSRPVFLEKTPQNLLWTRWLQRHFENAHFIGIVRNGYAVAEGIHRKAGHPLDACAEQWRRANEILLADFEHLERKLLLSYEELTGDPRTTYRRICAFLGLDTGDEETLLNTVWNFQKTSSPIRNMNARSIGALSEEQRRTIETHAGEVLRRLGYTFAA